MNGFGTICPLEKSLSLTDAWVCLLHSCRELFALLSLGSCWGRGIFSLDGMTRGVPTAPTLGGVFLLWTFLIYFSVPLEGLASPWEGTVGTGSGTPWAPCRAGGRIFYSFLYHRAPRPAILSKGGVELRECEMRKIKGLLVYYERCSLQFLQ